MVGISISLISTHSVLLQDVTELNVKKTSGKVSCQQHGFLTLLPGIFDRLNFDEIRIISIINDPVHIGEVSISYRRVNHIISAHEFPHD